ncbi:MAG: hypothetical protein HRT67_12335 [Flavobacteriaceae bacterium]|nr:hypothetical protein [Flavobacteriaceae bacterium]
MKNKVVLLFIIVICFSCKDTKKEINEVSINQTNKAQVEEPIKKVETRKEESTAKVKQEIEQFVFERDTTRILEDYKRNIKQAKKLLKHQKRLDDNIIESLIPLNLEEFSFYYDLTYSTEENLNFFDKVDMLIIKKTQENIGSCIKRYSNLAEFVDGEYAEGFFDDVFHIAQRNSEKFCSIYASLTDVSKYRLESVYNEVCKESEISEN